MTSASTYSEKETNRPEETAVSPPPPPPEPQVAQVDLERLPRQTPPPLQSRGRWHGHDQPSGPMIVIMQQAALRQIIAHSQSNRQVELGGALLGQPYRHNGQVYVEVKAALPASSGDHGPIHFTFNADSWSQLQRDREAHYPNLEIVGWFHTHPDLGVFYSGDDVVVHSAAFTLPWQVGLVVDPVRNEAGIFGWVDGQLAPLPGFYELLASQSPSIITWTMVRPSVWQHSYEEHLAAQRPSSRVYTPTSQRPSLGSISGMTGLVVGGLGLLLSFFLLVGWVVPLNREVDRLETVVRTLAGETLAEGNAATCPDPDLRILTPLTNSSARAGSQVEIIGSAHHPDAARYRVEVRPAGADLWSLVEVRRRATDLGLLATWDTNLYQPANYELRLTAVDANNVRLKQTELCVIPIKLTP